jgi:hypothetical protein
MVTDFVPSMSPLVCRGEHRPSMHQRPGVRPSRATHAAFVQTPPVLDADLSEFRLSREFLCSGWVCVNVREGAVSYALLPRTIDGSNVSGRVWDEAPTSARVLGHQEIENLSADASKNRGGAGRRPRS